MIIIIIIVDNSIFYPIPGTESRYYINIEGDIYNPSRKKYLTKEGNTVRISINGSRSRYNCDKLLIEALISYITYIKSSINSLVP